MSNHLQTKIKELHERNQILEDAAIKAKHDLMTYQKMMETSELEGKEVVCLQFESVILPLTRALIKL